MQFFCVEIMFISSDLIIKFISNTFFVLVNGGHQNQSKPMANYLSMGKKRLIFANNKGLKELIKMAYAIYLSVASYTLCSFQSK